MLSAGAKQFTQLKNWVPTLMGFGGMAGLTLVYITDWRVVADYIPFYNGKFKPAEGE